MLGIVIPPLGGVIIGEWLRDWRRVLPEPGTYAFPALRWGNLAAYAAGALAAWGTGVVGWGVPPINGVVVAVLGVFVFGLASRGRPAASQASGTPPGETETK